MQTIANLVTGNPELSITALGLVYELIVRKTPTEKTYSLLTFLGRIINGVIADKAKSGSTH